MSFDCYKYQYLCVLFDMQVCVCVCVWPQDAAACCFCLIMILFVIYLFTLMIIDEFSTFGCNLYFQRIPLSENSEITTYVAVPCYVRRSLKVSPYMD